MSWTDPETAPANAVRRPAVADLKTRSSPWSRRRFLAAAAAGPFVPSAARSACQAERTASLGGAVTEILYRLGAGPRIVAVDTTSLFPAEAMRDKPNVGYLRSLSAEGLLSLQPDLVLAAEGAGPAKDGVGPGLQVGVEPPNQGAGTTTSS